MIQLVNLLKMSNKLILYYTVERYLLLYVIYNILSEPEKEFSGVMNFSKIFPKFVNEQICRDAIYRVSMIY